MKRTIKIALVLFGLIFAYSTSAQAQEFKGGGGLAFGSEVEAIGIQATGVYSFTEEISGAADFIIFFPDNYDFWELNINAHYGFYAEDNISIYGLAGLNYAKMDWDGFGDNSELGLNLGGGAEFGLDFANLYTELKYSLSDFDQLVISAGLRFPF